MDKKVEQISSVGDHTLMLHAHTSFPSGTTTRVLTQVHTNSVLQRRIPFALLVRDPKLSEHETANILSESNSSTPPTAELLYHLR